VVGKDAVSVEAKPIKGKPVRLKATLPAGSLSGAVSLVARGKGSRWNFGEWTLKGDAVVSQTEHAVGPIIWTQYTLQDNGTLKLQAQMVPLEKTDPQTAELQFHKNGKWNTVAKAQLDSLSATFLFRVEKAEALPYRVVYRIDGTKHHWSGSIRPNPAAENDFKVALFTGDHGEIFPQDTMVGNVAVQDPDLLFFSGDQIYEIMDNISPVRQPLEGARLSYLSKWYQFGLTWRSLLKDRPSVIIPDDHDVFVGNVWGDNGLGYTMNPTWVNMVQRTQCGSLPDPVDPTPVKRGIGVYFTALDYAGMSFAIIEDRKFKSQPLIFTGVTDEVATGNGEKGGKQAVELFKQDPRKIDLPEANLLGERQLKFLTDWTARTEELPVRWYLSQTIFAKATTHAGPGLNRFKFDLDTNGWPQSKRDQALRTLGRDTIMLHGDLHLGILARLGIDEFDDGPLAFMVTGSCVGFPRAWWPDYDRAEGGEINGLYTGRYFDDLGNRLTVHGVTNPERVNGAAAWGRTPTARPDFDKLGGVFNGQHIKGSGHGIVVVDKRKKTAQFNAYRLDFDAKNPKTTDQFSGFPITLPLDEK
jgi:alkaline phosphatase D